jgi:hypothetical protein
MLLRVKSAVLTGGRSLPVYPDQQTFSEFVGMSQRCHKLTSEGDAKTGDGDAGYADPRGAKAFGQA